MTLLNKLNDTAKGPAFDALNEILKKKKNFISKINDTIQAIAVLIFISLVSMMFINTENPIDERTYNVVATAFFFLVLSSFYCLQTIISKLTDIFNDEKKT